MSTNKEFARLIVLRDKLMVLNNEIEKLENKLSFVKDATTRNRFERQLKQLNNLKKDIINEISLLSMQLDFDPVTFVNERKKRR
jgi:hypothetical protein